MSRKSGSRAFKLKSMLTVILGGFSTVALAWASVGRHTPRPVSERYALANVRRMDLYPALTASGRVESSKRTLIECELEAITIGVKGERLYRGRRLGPPERDSRRIAGASRRCAGCSRLLGLRRAAPSATNDRGAGPGRPRPSEARV